MTKTQKNDLYVTKIKMWGLFFWKKKILTRAMFWITFPLKKDAKLPYLIL